MLDRLYNLRYWVSWIALVGVAVAIVYWGFLYSTDPRTVRLAVAADEAWHNEFGESLKRNVERQTDYRVQLLRTDGPDDSRSRILDSRADLAVARPGNLTMPNLAAVAPLWDEYVQILVRTGSGIESIEDLTGSRVAIGPEDSANRIAVKGVLNYYGISLDNLESSDTRLSEIEDDERIDAAVVTRSLKDRDLREVVATGDFEFLSLPFTEGFAFNARYAAAASIPAGVYAGSGLPRPRTALDTLSANAILVGRPDLPGSTVEMLLRVMQSVPMRPAVPAVADGIPINDGVWRMLPAHTATAAYFRDRGRFGAAAGVRPWLAERVGWITLLAVIALIGVYQWRRQRLAIRDHRHHGVKRELERLFQELFRIEEAQREARDVRVLHEYLAELNQTKMKALKIALGTPVGESSLFLAFLQQARAVSQQIEWRLSMSASPGAGGEIGSR